MYVCVSVELNVVASGIVSMVFTNSTYEDDQSFFVLCVLSDEAYAVCSAFSHLFSMFNYSETTNLLRKCKLHCLLKHMVLFLSSGIQKLKSLRSNEKIYLSSLPAESEVMFANYPAYF